MSGPDIADTLVLSTTTVDALPEHLRQVRRLGPHRRGREGAAQGRHLLSGSARRRAPATAAVPGDVYGSPGPVRPAARPAPARRAGTWARCAGARRGRRRSPRAAGAPRRRGPAPAGVTRRRSARRSPSPRRSRSRARPRSARATTPLASVIRLERAPRGEWRVRRRGRTRPGPQEIRNRVFAIHAPASYPPRRASPPGRFRPSSHRPQRFAVDSAAREHRENPIRGRQWGRGNGHVVTSRRPGSGPALAFTWVFLFDAGKPPGSVGGGTAERSEAREFHDLERGLRDATKASTKSAGRRCDVGDKDRARSRSLVLTVRLVLTGLRRFCGRRE